MSRGMKGESVVAQGARRVTEVISDSARGVKGRWSSRRKVSLVLELLRGAELETTSRKYGVTGATLTHWREAFLVGGENGLKSRTVDVVDEEQKRLQSAVVLRKKSIQDQPPPQEEALGLTL